MSLLAETSSLVGDIDHATNAYRLLAPWAAFNVANYPEAIRGSVSRYLGILATTTKHWPDAERHFDDALAMNEKMGALPWVAHTRVDYAAMLIARGDAAEREHARQLLDEALTTYRALAMNSHASSVSQLIGSYE